MKRWRDIEGYEGLYEVSDSGDIRSITRRGSVGGKRKLYKTKKGYMRVSLYKQNAIKTFSVHRLVANAFIENGEQKPQVNHKNGNKADNSVNNLEWCTSYENMRHAYDVLKAKPTMLGKNGASHNRSKRVVAISRKSGTMFEYGSMREAGRVLSVNQSAITKSCKGDISQVGKYSFYDLGRESADIPPCSK